MSSNLPRRRVISALLATGPLLATGRAHSQIQPGAKPITIVVPFPPGGGTDAFARPLVAQLERVLGEPVVIDNRGGGGGNVGALVAAKAPPDGRTWFMGAVHHAIAPALYPKLGYSLKDSFVPVALVASVPQVIVVNPSRIAARTLPEFLAYARRNPGKIAFGSAGGGTSHHLAGELFKLETRTFLTHIPYRGAGPALADLVAGQVDMMFDGFGSSAQHIRAGRIFALAVAADRKVAAIPTIPTTADAGLGNYRAATWYGLWAPRGTAKESVDSMVSALAKVFAAPEIRDGWNALGAEVPTTTGRAFGEFVDAEIQRWDKVVRTANVKLEG